MQYSVNGNKIALGFYLFFASSGFLFAAPQPAEVSVGGVILVPFLGIEEKYDNNILFSEKDEKSSMITILAPSVQLGIQKGINTYGTKAAAQAGFFASSSADNYFDAQLEGVAHHEFTRRNALDLKAQYNKAHEGRGTAYSQGGGSSLAEPDEFYTVLLGGDYTYGSLDAIGRIKLSASQFNKIYSNHRTITKRRDRDITNVGATFYYLVRPKTSLLFELKHANIDYRLSSVPYDSTENRFFVGGEWDITAMTKGSARGGLLQKSFDNADRKDFSGFSWEISGSWSPLRRTQFTLETSGKTNETLGIGDYIDTKTVAFGWLHEWSQAISSEVDSFLLSNKYSASTREEGIVSLRVSINYDMRRWLSLTFAVGHSQRLSNQVRQDYKKNEASIGVLVTL